MNMEPVRFGVIDCGLMGREFASVSMRWLHLACELPRPVIVAACSNFIVCIAAARNLQIARKFLPA